METRQTVYFFIIIFTFMVWSSNTYDKCIDPVGEDGYCIFAEDCPQISKILENPNRRRNDSIFIADSFCGRTFSNNISKLKVCCDVTTINIVPGCVVPIPPINGMYEINGLIPEPGTVVPYRSVLKYHCDQNYSPKPRRSTYCQKNDNWLNKISCTYSQINVETNSNCQYPQKAVKIQRTKQIALNKCIDLADSVFPCLFTNGEKKRVEKCDHSQELEFGEPKPINSSEFPHLVTLVFSNSTSASVCSTNKCLGLFKYCGGSIISDQWILTKTNCAFQFKKRTSVQHVKLGDDAFDVYSPPDGNTYKIIEIYQHPNFTNGQVYNEISLLKIEKPIAFSSKIRPACLHTGNHIDDSKLISIWWENNINNSILYKESVKKYSHEDCSKLFTATERAPYGIREEIQFCAGSMLKNDKNKINRGFPLQIYNDDVYCTYTIVGIATHQQQNRTSDEYPYVFTRIAPYVPWIESIVWP